MSADIQYKYTRGRHRAGFGQALRLEFSMQQGYLIGCGLFTVVPLLLAAFGLVRIAFFPILMALVAPIMFRESESLGSPLRSALGISRARSTRARVAAVNLTQLTLAAAAMLIAWIGPGEFGLISSSQYSQGAPVLFWADVLTWMPALVIGQIATGNPNRSAPPNRMREYTPMLVFLAAYLSVYVGAQLVHGALRRADLLTPGMGIGDMEVWVAIGLLVLVVALVVLALRIHTWLKEV